MLLNFEGKAKINHNQKKEILSEYTEYSVQQQVKIISHSRY